MCLQDAPSCKVYLLSLPQGAATVQRAEALAQAMLDCQPTDQAYHEWAADSVLDVRIQLEKCLLSAPRHDAAQNKGASQASKVCIALESVLMSILHSSVMESLAGTHAGADGAVYRQAQEHHIDGCQVLSPSLARLTGAGKSLVSMDLSQASAALRDMDSNCCCPLEMLRCITEADTSLAESASKMRRSVSNQQAVSADDLLSSTIAAIVVAQPRHLVSCLEYIKLFHGAGDWSGKTGFQVATLEAAAAYIEQGDPAFSSSPAPGVAPRHSQEFVRALLEHDEPLTFANSIGALHPPPLSPSSPVRIPSRQKGHSPDTIRYGHGKSLRQLISKELMQRAASLQQAASLQRQASLRRSASGTLLMPVDLQSSGRLGKQAAQGKPVGTCKDGSTTGDSTTSKGGERAA